MPDDVAKLVMRYIGDPSTIVHKQNLMRYEAHAGLFWRLQFLISVICLSGLKYRANAIMNQNFALLVLKRFPTAELTASFRPQRLPCPSCVAQLILTL
jgi:hypothetical protein